MRKERESIMTDDMVNCFIHKKYLGVEVKGTELHHVIHGVANRKIADQEKCFCMLCSNCHRLLHDNGYHDKDLQQIAEKAWLEYNNETVEDWIQLFGKNFLN